ncbi:MAG: SpoIIE family protein phosphatase [Alphaproteobacteria bacterium]|nr:SpoIIE family protein phosphatase [Alphaproteobacteria bacterium]
MTPPDEDAFDRTTVFVPSAPRPATTGLEEMGHYLLVIDGGEPGQRVEIGDKPMIIGRDPGCSFVINDSQVSRRHCSVGLRFETAVLTDNGSTNGTYVGGKRIAEPVPLTEGMIFTIGNHVLQYEKRNRRETRDMQELDRSLAKASKYVHSLLPAPLREGDILTEWFYLPSERLGGDAFGYFALDDDNFAIYIVDVSGHGVGAAMHSVSLLNVLRQRALPSTDLTKPAQVVGKLNQMFPMEDHDDMYFTMWYGVWNRASRRLAYCTAGHHAGFLLSADKASVRQLRTEGPIIGLLPDFPFETGAVDVPRGETLYLFSDGVFEIITHEGAEWALVDFEPLLIEPTSPMQSEPDRLHAAVRSVSRPGPFDDDFSILTVTFE